MSDLPVAVNISDLGAPGWDWIGGRFAEDPFRWLSFTARSSSWLENRVRRPKIGRYRACWQGIAAARRERAKVIVTHEALVAAWTSAFYQANQLDAPHLAFAFTFSKLPTGARRQAFKRAVRSVDRFVCFSSVERARYADYFDIPIEKIDTLRWSVAEPDFDASEAPIESGEYLCAVGSEGRDYATLIEAMRRLPELKLVLVATREPGWPRDSGQCQRAPEHPATERLEHHGARQSHGSPTARYRGSLRSQYADHGDAVPHALHRDRV